MALCGVEACRILGIGGQSRLGALDMNGPEKKFEASTVLPVVEIVLKARDHPRILIFDVRASRVCF